ncbi:hypothetical protein [Streptomyces sp. NPDC001205]
MRADSPLQVYPLPVPDGEGDPRFTLGLVLDVRAALEAHGYPEISHGLDLLDLRQALFRFLHTNPTNERRAGA